jgi:hypothetical protein
MALTLFYVYEQDYILQVTGCSGWPDDGGGGMTMFSWYDRDLAGGTQGGVVIPLATLEPGFFQDGDDVFWVTLPGNKSMFTTEIFPEFFIDEDVFFIPMSVRALTQPNQMLRNEVRRVR